MLSQSLHVRALKCKCMLGDWVLQQNICNGHQILLENLELSLTGEIAGA